MGADAALASSLKLAGNPWSLRERWRIDGFKGGCMVGGFDGVTLRSGCGLIGVLRGLR